MDTQYIYMKTRAQFGSNCDFCNTCSVLETSIPSEPILMQNFVRRDPVIDATQCDTVFARHKANTTTATFKDDGMNHVEGGWPKDINLNDLEQTVRYRRKMEKDELYIHTMLQSQPPMEQNILQNNACDIYEQYFHQIDVIHLVRKSFLRTVNVFRDPIPLQRSIPHMSWSPDQGIRLAISHCDTDFRKVAYSDTSSYIWDIQNPNRPFMILKPPHANLSTEYNPKDCNTLLSGMMSGQVASWDIRRGSEPVEISSMEDSHRDPCSRVLWINSKTGTEFFSASKDGQILNQYSIIADPFISLDGYKLISDLKTNISE